MNRLRLPLLIAVLLAGTLACSLSSSSGDSTPIPTQTVVVFQVTPTAFVAPTLTPMPSVTPRATTAPQPTVIACTPNQTWPLLTVQSGDTLFAIATRTGTSVAQLVSANCLSNANAIQAGQLLHVPNLPPQATVTPAASQTPPVVCPNAWFFAFDAGKFDSRRACPNVVQTVSALGQDFEGGRVLRYDALPGSTDTRGTIYIIYNDNTWETYIDPWTSGMPESDPGIVPPTGRYAPTRGIGLIWRDTPGIRAKLGWAYENAVAFTGRYQEPTSFTGIWADRYPYFYVDHGKWGVVLRLNSVNMGANTYEVAGKY